MYNMSQQHIQYAYPAPVPTAVVPTAPIGNVSTRQYANHSNSSAFSSSANPGEDWTKISDLAERRRIQNRIAQRNYRKKLKRRLEDLERRAGPSDDTSPSPSDSSRAGAGNGNASGRGSRSQRPKKQQHTLASLSAASAAVAQQQQQRQAAVAAVTGVTTSTSPYQSQTMYVPHMKPQTIGQSPFTPPLHPEDDLLFTAAASTAAGAPPQPSAATSVYDDRERSHTPPSMFSAYSAYPPPPDDMLMGYSSAAAPTTTVTTSAATHAYRPASMADATTYDYNDWASTATATMAGVPVTLPSMHHFTDSLIKRESCSSTSTVASNVAATDDAAAAAAMAATTMAPSYMSAYNFLSTAGMDPTNPYDSHPHTPPLSHSYDHSTNCSDAGYDYPTTPLSMPTTPDLTG